MRKRLTPLFLLLVIVVSLFTVLPVEFAEAQGITYTPMCHDLYPSTINTWVEYDIYTEKGIPKGAIVEILCWNPLQASECIMGVRTKGSSLERKIDIHEAEGGGATTATMLVKTDPVDGKIELYTQFIATWFMTVGYFEGCDFTERFDDLGTSPGWWEDKDLSVFGAPANSVAQVLVTNQEDALVISLGVRTNDSSLERKLAFDEAEGGGSNALSFIVKCDGNSLIEVYRVGTGTAVYYLLGWLSSNVDFTEAWTQVNFASSKDDGIWQSRTLTHPEANSIVAFALTHTDSGAETWIGLREEGSSLNRILQEHEAEGGGATGFQICVTVDALKKLEIRCTDASESLFYYSGYFSEIEAEGEEYLRFVSQTLSLQGASFRFCVFGRIGSQGISLSSGVERTWSTSRFTSAAITMTPVALRTWSLTRVQTQDMSFVFNTFTKLGQLFEGMVDLGLTLASNAARSWTLLREVSQGISASVEGSRILGAFRTLTQGMTMTSGMERTLTAIRTASQSITSSFNTERLWSLSRVLTQSISGNFNIERLWSTTRSASQGISTALNAERLWTLSRTLNQVISTSFTG